MDLIAMPLMLAAIASHSLILAALPGAPRAVEIECELTPKDLVLSGPRALPSGVMRVPPPEGTPEVGWVVRF